MTALSEIADYNLTLIKNRLVCGYCGKTWKADPRKNWDDRPGILPHGWEQCPDKCHAKRLAARRKARAKKPPGHLAPVLTAEEKIRREERLTALRNLWTRYTDAFDEGKTGLAHSLYERYSSTGGLALPLDEPPIDPETPPDYGKQVDRVMAMWG